MKLKSNVNELKEGDYVTVTGAMFYEWRGKPLSSAWTEGSGVIVRVYKHINAVVVRPALGGHHFYRLNRYSVKRQERVWQE